MVSPQGSVLGPILFLLFVNHIAANLSCQFKIFAGDLKMYMNVCGPDSQNYADTTAKCQSDISTLHLTAQSWGLRFNIESVLLSIFKEVRKPFLLHRTT